MDTLEGIGVLLAFFGVFAVVGGVWKSMTAGKIARSPLVKTGDAATKGMSIAGPKGEISVEGPAVCDDLVLSPVTHTPCLYYEYEVVATWKETEWDETAGQNKQQEKQKSIADEHRSARVAIDDGSGPVRIDLESGGEMELVETFKDSHGGELLQSFKSFTEGREHEYSFGHIQVPVKLAPPDSKFTVKERVLRPDQRFFVCGMLTGDGMIGAPGMSRMIVSPKTREQLLGDTVRWTRELLIGGGATATVGMFMFNWIAALCLLAMAAAGYGVMKKYSAQVNACIEKVSARIAQLRGHGKPTETPVAQTT